MKQDSTPWGKERAGVPSGFGSAPDPENGPGRSVCLCDHERLRSERVATIVSQCGARPLLRESLTSLHRAERSPHCGLVLVALRTPPAPGDLTLDIIAALNHKGFHVIAYEDGAQHWAVGCRCRALLAGAASLLDSATPEFGASVAHLIGQFLQAESQRAQEEHQVRNTMRKLSIVGESQSMMTLFRSILRISTLSDVPVLIAGETGTGKELVARAIHSLDLKRCGGPFVALNCAAVSAGLAESELFGHRRGAFTGADQQRKGLIRSAQGGILFLDEIGEMELPLQAKLLRVLQEGRVLGVGEDQEVPVNMRVLAASNRDLEQMVREKLFRGDLFHRLNVLSLRLPPLRERREDILPLIVHFLAKYEPLGNCAGVDPDFLEALALLDLPGNVRELENLIRSALVNRRAGSALCLGDLPLRVWQELTMSGASHKPVQSERYETAPRQATPGEPGTLLQIFDSRGWNLSRSLDYCERVLLESALELARGNQAQVARMLGITPRCLYNKVHKHHLQCKRSA